MPGHPDAIIILKTGGAGAGDVARLSHYLDVFEAATGLARGETRILPVATETAADTLKPMEFVDTALPSLAGLIGGAEDLSTALGASTNLNPETEGWGLVCRLARAQVLLAARAAGVAAFDTLHVDFRDEDGLRKSSAAASEEGFTGRIAIHPAQVAPINAAFAPSEAAVAHTRRIVAAFDAYPGAGTVGLDGRMIDIPHLKQARQVLALHDAIAARG